MKKSTVSYTLRLRTDLKRLLETAAKSGAVSLPSLIADACWKYLDIDGGVETEPHRNMAETLSSVRSANGWPAEPSKPSMDALRAICAGDIETTDLSQPAITDSSRGRADITETSACSHKEWAEDGEQYRCALTAGHKGKCKPGERVNA